MIRGLLVACLLAAGCSRPATEQAGGAPSASAAPSPVAKRPERIGFGMSASGPGHASVQVEAGRAEDNDSVAALRPQLGALGGCYQKSGREALRVSVHVSIGAAGAVTTSGSTVPAGDDATLKCVEDAVAKAPFPAASRGTSFDVAIRLSP